MASPYSAVTDDEEHYTQPIDIDIMKCFISKGHYCSLSGGLYPVQGHMDSALALCCNMDNASKSHWSIKVNTIIKNSITQLSPNNYNVVP